MLNCDAVPELKYVVYLRLRPNLRVTWRSLERAHYIWQSLEKAEHHVSLLKLQHDAIDIVGDGDTHPREARSRDLRGPSSATLATRPVISLQNRF